MYAVNKRSGIIFAVAGTFATTCSMVTFTLACSLHQTMHGFTIRGNGPSFGHRQAQRFRSNASQTKSTPIVKNFGKPKRLNHVQNLRILPIIASLRPFPSNTTTSKNSPTKYCTHVGQHTQHSRNVVLNLIVGFLARLSINTLSGTPTRTRKRNPDK